MVKTGYTTGTYATGAAKGATLVLVEGICPETIEVHLPGNKKAHIPADYACKGENYAECGVTKISVEKTDVTHNLKIIARVSFRQDTEIMIHGGPGIGRITRKGLPLPVGEVAINPIPRKMIKDNIREITERGIDVTISAPGGEEIARLTYNPKLGIVGGISIIGTTGIMTAKSSSAFKKTIYQHLQFCRKNNIHEIVIVPGNISERAIKALTEGKIGDEQIVQSGDFLGFTIKWAVKMGFSFAIAGHPGKVAKTLGGYFQTHYKKSPLAKDFIIPFLEGQVEGDLMDKIKTSPTSEGIISLLREHNQLELMDDLADIIGERIKEYAKLEKPVPVILFDMSGTLSGLSKEGMKWIRRLL